MLWCKFPFVPGNRLLRVIFLHSLTSIFKPCLVSVEARICVLQPSLNKHICRVVIEGSLDKLSHGEAGW
jgi:hypothetical protein